MNITILSFFFFLTFISVALKNLNIQKSLIKNIPQTKPSITSLLPPREDHREIRCN